MSVVKRLSLLSLAIGALLPTASHAAILFSDDFESGTLSNWPIVAGTAMTNVEEAGKNTVPALGTHSLKGVNSSSHVARNLGFEVSGAFTFTSYIWDDGQTGTGGSNRVFTTV